MSTSAEQLIEPLPWDSLAFGYAVGRASWENPPTTEMLSSLSVAAKREGFRLVYCSWPGIQAGRLDASKCFSYFGGHQWYAIRCPNLRPATGDTRNIRICRRSTTALQRLALQSGLFSRFALDPMFRRNEFQTLYRHWLENSFDNAQRATCCISGTPDDPDGFLTLETAGDNGSIAIGLFAVHERCRRTGIGTRLLNFARLLSLEAGATALMVKTQVANEAGKAFYERNGFEKAGTQSVAHFWSESS